MALFKTLLSLLIYVSLVSSPAHAKIKIGIPFFYPPFILSDKTGFDIQFMELICEQMQEQCVIIPMDYYRLFTALDTGKIDIAIGGISIVPDKANDYIYSLPYLVSYGEFLVLKTNKITSINELRGTLIGVMTEGQGSGNFYNYLQTHFANQFKVQKFNTMENLISALLNGTISAAFTHQPTAEYWKLNANSKFKTIGKHIAIGGGIGIMATPKNAALIQEINKQSLVLEQKKIYLDLYSSYFPNYPVND